MLVGAPLSFSISGQHSGSNISRQICTINSWQSRTRINKVHLQVGMPKGPKGYKGDSETMEAVALNRPPPSTPLSGVPSGAMNSTRNVSRRPCSSSKPTVWPACAIAFSAAELSFHASHLQRQLYHPQQGNFDESDVSPWPGSTADSVAEWQHFRVLQSSDSVLGRGAPRTTVRTPLFLIDTQTADGVAS